MIFSNSHELIKEVCIMSPNCVLTKFDGSSFFVKSQSAVLIFCHFTSFVGQSSLSKMKKVSADFSVKSSWEVHWIISKAHAWLRSVLYFYWHGGWVKKVQSYVNVIYAWSITIKALTWKINYIFKKWQSRKIGNQC